jgi:DNA-binding response OmpR family regulator
LSREGYDVKAMSSGEEALKYLQRESVDLVLCDIVMDGMDGVQVLREVRNQCPGTPVIMMTGYGSMDSAIETLRLGASDYIQKPAAPEELHHRIRSVLDAICLRRNLQDERQKAAERKRELYERVVRAERMVSLGVLADGMAYELNNILGPVVSYPGLILEKLSPDSPLRQYIREIAEAGKMAVAVTHDLQTIGRTDQYHSETIDLNEVVQAYLKSADYDQVLKQHSDVVWDFHLQEQPVWIRGSRTQLKRVVENLVLNGIDSIAGEGRLSIRTYVKHMDELVGLFAAGDSDDYVVLEISDSGAGLDPRDLERIFEPFYSRKRLPGGRVSGLGLTLVYRVVKDHHGYIDVRSERGKGSCFILYFPLEEEKEELQEETKVINYGGSETILVVDDYEEQRRVAATLLTSLGYQVLTAGSGQAAVKMFESMAGSSETPAIDLVVLDMILADDFDGLETYKRIAEIVPDQKVVIVSGFAETDRIVEVRKLGARRYVQKPYSLETLGRVVREELES